MSLFKKKVNKSVQGFIDSGIFVESIDDNKLRNNKQQAKKCLWNALIIFMVVYGSMGFFATAFELPVNHILLIISAALSALYFSLMNLNSWTFNLGYIIFLFILIGISITLYMIINSGFSAIINILIVRVDEVMNLPSLREFTEFYKNRPVSISVCLAFLEMVLTVFVSMWITKRMSVWEIIFYCMITVIVGSYLKEGFSYFHLALMIFACFLHLLSLQADEFPVVYKKKNKNYKIVKKTNIKLKNRSIEPKGFSAGAIVLTLVALIMSLILFAYVPTSYLNRRTEAKKYMDDKVYTVAFRGFSALWNKKSSGGGMDNGAFGNNGQVSFDYETDLQVRYVPNTNKPVYLRTYTSNYYDNVTRKWKNNDEFSKMSYTFSRDILEDLYLKGEGSKGALAYMEIDNIGAGNNVTYEPYYMFNKFMSNVYDDLTEDYLFEVSYPTYHETKPYEIYKNLLNSTKSVTFGLGDTYSFYYYPNYYSFEDMYKLEPNSNLKIYKEYVRSNYLNVDGKTETGGNVRDVLEEICKEEKFGGSDLEIIDQIHEYLESNFEYSLNPGVTPNGEDFVINFLTSKKQGYCVHFASAGCLLLRTMGIPARYVEGYCFDITNFDDATIVDNQGQYKGFGYHSKNEIYSGNLSTEPLVNKPLADSDKVVDWYSGYNEYSIDTAIEIDVTDANAHAWVEVFIDGFGWVPYEFTTAAMALGGEPNSGEGGSGLLEMLSRFMVSGNGGQSNNDNSNTTSSLEEFAANLASKETKEAFESALIKLLITIILVIIALIFINLSIIYYKLYIDKTNRRAVNQYKYITDKTKKKLSKYYRKLNKIKADNTLDSTNENIVQADVDSLVFVHSKLKNILVDLFNIDFETVENYINLNLKYNYSNDNSELLNELTISFKKLLSDLKNVKVSKL